MTILILLALCLVAGCGSNKVEKAEKLLKAGSTSEAVDLLREEIKDNPDNAEAFLVLGKTLYKTDRLLGQEKLLSAVKVNSSYKERVTRFILSNVSSRSDLDFLNQVETGYVDRDADLCFKYYVDMAPDFSNAVAFADKYPRDSRAPTALLRQASCLKAKSCDSASKVYYQKVVKKYPASKEAKEAKGVLSDWWVKIAGRIPADHKWHSFAVEKGQKYRYEISGDVVLQDGFGALHHFNGEQTTMFIGTRNELQNMMDQFNSGRGYSGPMAATAGSFGSGTAPRGDRIWFLIETGGEFSGGLDLILEVKDRA